MLRDRFRWYQPTTEDGTEPEGPDSPSFEPNGVEPVDGPDDEKKEPVLERKPAGTAQLLEPVGAPVVPPPVEIAPLPRSVQEVKDRVRERLINEIDQERLSS